MTNKDIIKIALEQSAIDYGLTVSDFSNVPFSICEPKAVSKEARNYLKRPPYCNFIY